MTITDQLKDLVELDSDSYRLSDWEVEFIDAMEKRERSGHPLTKSMESAVGGIWDSVFIHGKRGRK